MRDRVELSVELSVGNTDFSILAILNVVFAALGLHMGAENSPATILHLVLAILSLKVGTSD